jgi:hypothetical protein
MSAYDMDLDAFFRCVYDVMLGWKGVGITIWYPL